tara:strand:+ start:2061 stop:3530 length:1470 start_codon:yes stop_codon:yes gene_type:complete
MKPIYLEKTLGIDLREESVALALLGKQFRSVNSLASHFFEVDRLQDDKPETEKKFLDEINRFLINCGENPDQILITLPRNYFTLKSFDLPAPNRKAVKSMIEFELERHCATDHENLYYDFKTFPRSEKMFRVVLVAINKEIADYYITLFQRISLKLSSISVSSIVNLETLSEYNDFEDSIAILTDLNVGSLETSIIKNGALEMSRNISLLTPESREAHLKDGLPESRVKVLAGTLSHLLVEEIQTCLSVCNQIGEDEEVEAVYLFGGGQCAPSLARKLEDQIYISCIPAVFPNNLEPDAAVPTVFFNTALGLALNGLERQGLNVLPLDLKPKKKTFSIKTTLGLAAGVVLLSCGLLVAKILRNSLTLGSLETQFNEVKKQVGTLEKVDLKFDDLKQYIAIFNAIDQTTPLKLPILRELSRIIPTDTWLTDISIVKNKLEIKGFSSSASKIVPLIEKSPYFQDTTVKGTIVNRAEGEEFAIRSNLVRRKP